MEQDLKIALSGETITKSHSRLTPGTPVYLHHKGKDHLAVVEGYRYVGTVIRLIVESKVAKLFKDSDVFSYTPKQDIGPAEGLMVVRVGVETSVISKLTEDEMVESEVYQFLELVRNASNPVKANEKLKSFTRLTDANKEAWFYGGGCPIRHQQQSREDSCVSACIAMVLNIVEEEIVDDFHETYQKGATVSGYLKNLKVPHERLYADDRSMPDVGSVYLVRVCSLNRPGQTHMLVMAALGEDMPLVFDPNQGKEGKKFYTSVASELENNPDAFEMINYSPVIRFKTNYVLKRYRD